MQKNPTLLITLICVIAFSLIYPLSQCLAFRAEPQNSLSAKVRFQRLKSELEKRGVSDEFIKITARSVERMISSAAQISDIEIVLLDLWFQNVKGRALKNAVASVAELVESGDNILEAAKIASTAAHKAEAEGLSGFGVGMRVKKAVKERKAYLKAAEK